MFLDGGQYSTVVVQGANMGTGRPLLLTVYIDLRAFAIMYWTREHVHP